MPGTDVTGVNEAFIAGALGTKGVKDRHDHLDMRDVAATHQAVAVLLAPHATADATVDEPDPLGLELGGVHDVIGELAVTTVHHEVALGEKFPQSGDRLGCRSTGRHHDDHDARSRQGCDQLLQARNVAAG